MFEDWRAARRMENRCCLVNHGRQSNWSRPPTGFLLNTIELELEFVY